jgi:Tol biopolymer transport system component
MRHWKHGTDAALGALSGLVLVSLVCTGCAEKVSGGRDDEPVVGRLVVDSTDPNTIERPAWIGNDTIVFSWNQGTPTDQLYTVKLSGGNPVRLIQDNPRIYLHPSYSANVDMVAFEVIEDLEGGANIDAIKRDGSAGTRYAAAGPMGSSSNQYPCWGPGANSIGYLQTRATEAPRFVMLELDKSYATPRPTGVTQEIEFEKGFQPSRPTWYAPVGGGPFEGKIAYNRIPPNAAQSGTEIYYYDLDPSLQVHEFRVTDEFTPDANENRNPSWSPDGTHIVYSTDYRTTESPEFGRELFVISVETGATVRLTRTGLNEEEPAWSPDGTMIAYIAGGDLYVLTLTAGQIPE